MIPKSEKFVKRYLTGMARLEKRRSNVKIIIKSTSESVSIRNGQRSDKSRRRVMSLAQRGAITG